MSKNTELGGLESQLTELDLSDQSEIKGSLCQELLLELRGGGSSTPATPHTSMWWNLVKRPAATLTLGMFLGISLLAVAHPDTRATLASIIKSIPVGEHTHIIQSEPFSSAEIEAILSETDKNLEEGRMFLLINAYGGYGGSVPDGAEPVIKQVSSLRFTAKLAELPLLVPTYFNEQIPPSFRFRYAQIFPDSSVMLYFGLGQWETILVQHPVKDRTITYSDSETTTDELGKPVPVDLEPQVEELLVEGVTVVWQRHTPETQQMLNPRMPPETLSRMETGRFLWEHKGISYQLNGRLLTKEEGLKIIASLQPLQKAS